MVAWSAAATAAAQMLSRTDAESGLTHVRIAKEEVTMSKVQDASAIARNHLSNERTYLSWIRTVMTFVGFGLVFTRLSGGLPSLAIGVAFILSGLVILAQAMYRYVILKRVLTTGSYQSSTTSIVVTTVITVATTVATLVVLIVYSQQFQKQSGV